MSDRPSAAPRKDEILALFADRMFVYFGDRASPPNEQPKFQQQYLNLRPDLIKQPLCPPEITGEYKKKLINIQLLNEDPDHPIQLIIKRRCAVDLDNHMVGLSIQANDHEIAVLDFEGEPTDSGYIFDIYHRLVEPKFRGPQNSSDERLSNILLKAAEDYMGHVAKRTQKPQVIGLKTDQLEVILWMLENGYEIATEDQKWWEMIQAGEPHIVMLKRHFCWVKDLADLAQLRRQEVDSNYFLTIPSVTIHFRKTILPDTSPEAAVEEVRRAVAGS